MKHDPYLDTAKITVAVVTGEHTFDVSSLYNMFRSMPEIEYYLQHLDQFIADWGNVRTLYNVVLFYNCHQATPPGNELGWWQGGTKEALEQLSETGQGIVILHHAIAAFPQWEYWSELVGIPHAERTYTLESVNFSFCETLYIEITDTEHPITRGLNTWHIYGETFGSLKFFPGPDCRILMTTDHPKMAMRAMAWTHQYNNARVFCLQPGHNNDSYADPNFRTVLSRGIQWAAGRL